MSCVTPTDGLWRTYADTIVGNDTVSDCKALNALAEFLDSTDELMTWDELQVTHQE